MIVFIQLVLIPSTLSSSVLMLHWTLFKLSLMDSFDCSITKIQSRMAPVCHINTYYWIIIAYLMHHCVNRIVKVQLVRVELILTTSTFMENCIFHMFIDF